MSSTVPATMKAFLVLGGRRVAVKEVPVPQVGDDDILVKNVAVAQNPTDWKYVDFIQNAGTILGCDWSGYVVQVGKNVTSPKVGDHVAGFVQGGTYADSGAYAEYVRTPADLSWTVPEGTVSYEEAATLGCALWTAVQALYEPSRLGLVEPPEKIDHEEWIFVSSGSSSVGQYAIQLAHLSGYKVATTSSPRNFELVRSLGADAVFDYHEPHVALKIKSATGNQIRHAFDTISLKDTQALSSSVMAPGGGKMILVLTPIAEARIRDDVEAKPTLIYTSLGCAFRLGETYPPSPTDRAHMAAFLRKLPALVAERKITPNRLHRWDGGLGAISDGLQYMREGKVSAEKIVYTL